MNFPAISGLFKSYLIAITVISFFCVERPTVIRGRQVSSTAGFKCENYRHGSGSNEYTMDIPSYGLVDICCKKILSLEKSSMYKYTMVTRFLPDYLDVCSLQAQICLCTRHSISSNIGF
jgi:hypothetical protein